MYAEPDTPVPKYIVTGSIISAATVGCTVWGAGIMYRDDWISPRACLLAVRGPLTRARSLECGAECPEVYGDPALLLPRLYTPSRAPRRGVGVILHMADKPSLSGRWRASREIREIDIQGAVEDVIDQIVSCELVLSSSLHGLIASHAYGVPALWARFRPLPSGDDSKFHDYLLSVGLEPVPPVPLTADLNPDALAQRCLPPQLRLDLAPLWAACPWRESQ